MILKGAVLIPDIPDSGGDVLDEETIRKAEAYANDIIQALQKHHRLSPGCEAVIRAI